MTEPGRAVAMRPKPSVAVLPFENLSCDPDQDYFGEGIAEDLITDLSRISGLFVVARKASFAARRTARDAVQASAHLQVGHVLEGSVRRAGDRLRISARLIEGATGNHVWAERYDRTLIDIFAVQDDITLSIVRALEIKLILDEDEALAGPPTANIEAYGLYLRGRQLVARHVRPSYELARRMFARAVELDPNFARALAGIAECNGYLFMHCGTWISIEDMLATAARATALEPSLARAHSHLGVALLASGRPEAAEQSFTRALVLDPYHVEALYAYARACAQQGRKEDAVRLMRRAADLDPDQVGYWSPLTSLYRGLGRTVEAEKTARKLLVACERQLAQHPESAIAAYLGAGALAIMGERERAIEWAGRALAIEPDDHLTVYNVACVYSLLGLLDKAMDMLERTMPGTSAHRHAWMQQDSDLDPVRGHPRFHALVDRLGSEA